jgi:serine phosphatase RsbU (regulator of sigma subunit)/pSer/pThr/pTyr-binding forkhead associated (FHA) protein
MALLQVVRGPNVGEIIRLESSKAVLGRHPQCDIVIDVGAVSRQHAQIVHENETFYVEDLHSRNGTYVNGELIQGRRRLLENDRVRICDVLLSFHEREPPHQESEDVAETVVPPALMVDDPQGAGTTIMGTLDVQSSRNIPAAVAHAEAKLKALMEIARTLRSTLSLERVLSDVLESLFKIFLQADRGYVVLQLPDGQLVPMATKHRRPGGEETIRISRTVVNKAMGSREAILSADAASDQRFDTSQSIADFRIRSMICAPLLRADGSPIGVIQIDTLDQRSRFTQDDLEVLASVAIQAATAVENAQLHEASLREQTLLRDLELAHKVQQGILPSGPPHVVGYQFFDHYDPANQVGGDYYDYVPLSQDRLGVVVADVSGKGISAALLMARLSSEARYCLATSAGPAEAMRRLNASFCRGGWEDRFVSMIACVVDTVSNEVTVCNAGHMAPRLRSASGKVISIGIEETGFLLGVDATYEYREAAISLAPGDSLTLFTDGISEAMNMANETYGLPRTDTCLERRFKGGIPEIGQTLLDDVRQFVGTRAQSDDICLICYGRSG